MESIYVKQKRGLRDGVTNTLSHVGEFRGISRNARILSILPKGLAGDVARLKTDTGAESIGYLFGDLNGDFDELWNVAALVEAQVRFPVLIIADLLPTEWIQKLKEHAPIEDDYSAVFEMFFARGMISDLFLRTGWRELPCVEELVNSAADHVQRTWWVNDECEINIFKLAAKQEAAT
ncbi:MAG: hypothetical protein HZA95_01190 [Candidatus Vogelbacteria bacterium]|nr:hypothetical protein [Candidatus Vogelbacteria bacterium]